MTELRTLRKRAQLTQEDLGAAVGVSRQTVINWESGNAWPSTALLPKIARTLGCTIDELFAEEQPQVKHNMEVTA